MCRSANNRKIISDIYLALPQIFARAFVGGDDPIAPPIAHKLTIISKK